MPEAQSEATQQFRASVAAMRPRLHRFCTRMSGSVLDGEDLVQETLAAGFDKLSSLRDPSRLESWLYRIAYNKCLDFIARRGGPGLGAAPDEEAQLPDAEVDRQQRVSTALALLVTRLPPKERASVVLKDVLDYSLAEVAAIVDSTVGGVKAALHRGRAKLESLPPDAAPPGAQTPERALINAYLERFNRRDWAAVGELVRADARLEIVDVIEAQGLEVIRARYFHRYAHMEEPWRFALARVDTVPTIVRFHDQPSGPVPFSAKRLTWAGGKVAAIREYAHIDYLLDGASVEPV